MDGSLPFPAASGTNFIGRVPLASHYTPLGLLAETSNGVAASPGSQSTQIITIVETATSGVKPIPTSFAHAKVLTQQDLMILAGSVATLLLVL